MRIKSGEEGSEIELFWRGFGMSLSPKRSLIFLLNFSY